jgi:Ca-activated chloride channel homolog
MRRLIVAIVVLLAVRSTVQAQGLLIPVDHKLPPLAVVQQKAVIQIDDQVAVTRIEQTFRNHTSRQLEATYVFPVPKGASVRKFTMWVGGREETGELVEADRARKIYTDIVRRTLDPGLLEYLNNNLIRLRVFPVLPGRDQRISLTYTSVAEKSNGLIEFVYPMRTGSMAGQWPQEFAVSVNLKSQYPITNIYSPSHPITYRRINEREVVIEFEKYAALLDRDFQMLYQAGPKDVGLTAVTHRPHADQDGHFMLLLSPRAELSKTQQVPRDFVMVLDTSGSMRGTRIAQAQKALKYCLKSLGDNDRFTLINFATTVNNYTESLQAATPEKIAAAVRWVDGLEATGGTAIDDALKAALALRSADEGRTFTVIFFTDGQPTVGETNANKIIANVRQKNTSSTRIFSFGVGDDVNTVLLDALADSTKAVSTFVRETEDIEAKVSSLYDKISNPVLANLKLSLGEGVTVNEVYPPQLPDLFHGSQLVVFGRYKGKGHAAVKLTGTLGKETKEFDYELDFAAQTGRDKAFVEDLWARRKVGYMLDQIRIHGESQELVREVIAMAKRYGIATPYTSYLLVPDGLNRDGFIGRPRPLAPGAVMPTPPALQSGFGGGGGDKKLADFAKGLKSEIELSRAKENDTQLRLQAKAGGGKGGTATRAIEARSALDQAKAAIQGNQLSQVQQGKLGVDFAVQNNGLRFQEQVGAKANQFVQGRNVLEVGGVWIDVGFDPKMEIVSVKAMSDAYFRFLERHPEIREVFQLGNYIVWVTPSGKALVIDQSAGQEEMSDAAIDGLFFAAKTGKKGT